MSILNSHFLMHAHHNFTSFVILYICLSKYKPYRAYVTNLIYSTINKVCLSVCLSVSLYCFCGYFKNLFYLDWCFFFFFFSFFFFFFFVLFCFVFFLQNICGLQYGKLVRTGLKGVEEV